MRQEQINIFKFSELSEKSKEKAIQKYKESNQDYEWWKFIYEDTAEIANLFGLDIRQTKRISMDKTLSWYDPTIFFSGFCSQGDGACFEGNYEYKKGSLKAIKDHAPNDTELHRIVKELQESQRKNFYSVRGSISHRGRYYHSGCMFMDFENVLNETVVCEDDFSECMRDFADWIYKRLENENDYRNSDSYIISEINETECEFYEDGEMF